VSVFRLRECSGGDQVNCPSPMISCVASGWLPYHHRYHHRDRMGRNCRQTSTWLGNAPDGRSTM